MKTLDIQSRQQTEMIDITSQVRRSIKDLGLSKGLVLVFTPHTTAGVTINENADRDVVRDMLMELNKIVPFADGYRHAEGNSAAHIKSTLVGCSESIPVEEGNLVLGIWQGIYFCEFDGPRQRRVIVQAVSA